MESQEITEELLQDVAEELLEDVTGANRDPFASSRQIVQQIKEIAVKRRVANTDKIAERKQIVNDFKELPFHS